MYVYAASVGHSTSFWQHNNVIHILPSSCRRDAEKIHEFMFLVTISAEIYKKNDGKFYNALQCLVLVFLVVIVVVHPQPQPHTHTQNADKFACHFAYMRNYGMHKCCRVTAANVFLIIHLVTHSPIIFKCVFELTDPARSKQNAKFTCVTLSPPPIRWQNTFNGVTETIENTSFCSSALLFFSLMKRSEVLLR